MLDGKKIGRRLYMERLKQEISQKKLAEILNIQQPCYSKKENGKSNFLPEELQKVCKFLNISVDDVLKD